MKKFFMWVVRAIRHGIRANKTPLLFMPSTESYFLSDEDLGSVIAYIKSAPPVDNELPSSTLSWTGRVAMTLVPAITFIPAELIPQDGPRPAAPEAGIIPEYGQYLTHSCKVCHGLTMSGGQIPGLSVQLASRAQPDVLRWLCPASLDRRGIYEHDSDRGHARGYKITPRIHALGIV